MCETMNEYLIILLFTRISSITPYLVYSNGAIYKLVLGWVVPVDVPQSVAYAQNIQFQYYAVDNATKYSVVFQEERKARNRVTRERVARAVENVFERKCFLYFICEIAASPIQKSGLLGELIQTIFTPSTTGEIQMIKAKEKGSTFSTRDAFTDSCFQHYPCKYYNNSVFRSFIRKMD
ncbi:hypothetical protein LSTR_LSTR008052 [Laodelphax striatellus]|uniref:Uncharacterized protein n=1 Tax=Laodelphax striatellus TaxID=195883 RepID=A0A482XMT5_LAOST|nr:hypothetical protein LSTR_LSTR008052 [Laodelphax striatellus]